MKRFAISTAAIAGVLVLGLLLWWAFGSAGGAGGRLVETPSDSGEAASPEVADTGEPKATEPDSASVGSMDVASGDAKAATGKASEDPGTGGDSAQSGGGTGGTRSEGEDPARDEGGRTRDLADVLEGADMSDPEVREQIVRQARTRDAEKRKAMLERAQRLGIPVRIEREDGTILELAGFDGDQPLYRATHNRDAAVSTGADALGASSYGLDGLGVRVGVWDEGSARSSHQELGHNTDLADTGARLSDHATHVAGTIGAAGVRDRARGMAPEVGMSSYDWNSDLTEMLAAGAAAAGATDRLALSNHSYGFLIGYSRSGGEWRWYGDGTGAGGVERAFGRYSGRSREWDAVAHSLPYLTVFKSAGNDREDNPAPGSNVRAPDGRFLFTYASGSSPEGDGDYRGGYDSQGYAALAKNVITVGAVDDAVSGGERDLSAAGMSAFSAWGPADDGRIKPDLVANGVAVYSPVADADAAYGSLSGTSMASPSAAGSAALLVDLYRNEFGRGLMRSSLLKGLLIHTADDIGPPGPDYRNGWGLVNVRAAADLLLEHKASAATPRMIEAAVSADAPSYSHEFEWDGSGPIRATLCWTDPAGEARSAHDSRTPNLVNNLDLVLTGPDGRVFRPFVMPYVGTWEEEALGEPAVTGKNDVDNVEQVLLSAPPQAGGYTATVSADGAPVSGRQEFSLLLSGVASDSGGGERRILALDGDLSFGSVAVGDAATRSVSLRNEGSAPLSVSRIELPAGFSGGWSGTLEAGASVSFEVAFRPDATGPFSGSLRAYSDADHGVATLAVSGEGVSASVIRGLDNGVPVEGLSGREGSERYFRLSVPPDQSEASFEISGTGDADLYVRYGSLPSVSEWDYRPFRSSGNETVTVTGPAAGDWYVMVRGYSDYSALTLVANHRSSGVAMRVIELHGDLDYGNIPVGDTVSRELTIRNTGNAALQVDGLSLPEGFSGDWSGAVPAGGEAVAEVAFTPREERVYLGEVTVASNKTAGTDSIAISGTGIITQIGLRNGVAAGPFSGLADSMSYFYIDVPPGQSSLRAGLRGADGEADLYLRKGSPPTLDDFDYRTSSAGHDDSLTVDNPEAGRWYVLLHAVTRITEVRLTAEYGEAADNERIIRLSGDLDFGGVRVHQTESRDLRIHNEGDVALSVFGLSPPEGFSGAWSGTVPPGESRRVAIDFNPEAAVGYSGTLSVQSDATSGTSTVALSGHGVADDSVTELVNGIPVSDLSGSEGSRRMYRIRVPDAAGLLRVSITGGSGDADLYLRHGAVPTLDDFDFRPYLSDSDESVDVEDPAAGDWFIMLHGYTRYSGVTLRASVPGGGGSVTEFADFRPIELDDSGPGSLYPSEIEVSGLEGGIAKVTVTLHELSHTYPSDLDLLLVAPDGTAMLLMSDAGGGGDISGLELTFDDDASSSLSEDSRLTSGVFRPTNFRSGDTFPASAPDAPYETTLSAFSGIDPNGNWALYVVDDAGLDSGSLAGGWSLRIETASGTAPPPDLTDGSGTHTLSPSHAAVGETLTFAADIANQGGHPSGAFEVRLQISGDVEFSDSDVLLDVVSVPSVEAGAVHSLRTTFDMPTVPEGDYYLGWQIDSGDAVGESDETNNNWYRTTAVTVSAGAWYAEASPLSDGWRYFDWFKGFKPEGEHWIYHGRHGWLFVLAEDTGGMFLWDMALERWVFTNATVYPWLFAYGPDEGWVFFFEGGRPGSRYFRRADTGEVVPEGELEDDS